jgi:hypothetical protein
MVNRAWRGRYAVTVAVFAAGPIRAGFRGELRPRKKVRALGGAARKAAPRAGTYRLLVRPSGVARKRKVRAKLVVSIAPSGYEPAEATRTIRLR